MKFRSVNLRGYVATILYILIVNIGLRVDFLLLQSNIMWWLGGSVIIYIWYMFKYGNDVTYIKWMF